jgi:hypothetical protein
VHDSTLHGFKTVFNSRNSTFQKLHKA